MRVVVYLRVSTEDQAKEGYSIPAQRERLEAFAKSQGWVIVDYYIEEGQSAKDLNRFEMQRLLTNIKKGDSGIDIVLVYRLDRLTRSVLDLYTLLKIFEENNVHFRSATEVYDTTTAMGRLFITLVAALAQWERENLAERVRMGLAEMVRQGRRPGSTEPYGYSYGENGGLEINPVEAEVIKTIFQLYNSGMGARGIVRLLNNPECPTPTKFNKKWADKTILQILTNPLYTGRFIWGRPYTERSTAKTVKEEYIHAGDHEPIIDIDTWETTQRILERHRRLPPRIVSSDYPLTGILNCGKCGYPVNGMRSTRRNKRTGKKTSYKRYYVCSNRQRTGTCDLPFFGSDDLENRILEYIESFDENELRELIRSRQVDIKNSDLEHQQLTAELQEIGARKRKWFDAYEAGAIDLIDLKERTKSIENRLTFIRERIKGIEGRKPWTVEEIMQKFKDVSWHWKTANAGERKEMLFSVFKSVKLLPDKDFKIELLD